MKMTEAEVSLRLAIHLLINDLVNSDIQVAIDGAQVKTGTTVHFQLAPFLAANNCEPLFASESWRGEYRLTGHSRKIVVHSKSGVSDLTASLRNGKTLRVESKKGPIVRSKSSSEYPLLREALGQLMTMPNVEETDLLAVAVPHSPKFCELAARWRDAPLIKRTGIQVLTVGADNSVSGLLL